MNSGHTIAQEDFVKTLVGRVRDATATNTALQVRGGGTKDFYGQQLEGETLDCSPYAGIIDYEPTELVVTARCGTPLSTIEATLNEHHQMLAFEPPHFEHGQAGRATVGGCVAAGLSGPRRQAAGGVRDFMLGAKLLDGKGEVLSFGGQVMKNVAGYDVSRALAGSLGILGLILEVSLKVLPRPAATMTLQFECDEEQALTWLNQWGGQPLPISASMWRSNDAQQGLLTIRLCGALAAVKAAHQRLGGMVLPDDEALTLWAAVREQSHSFFNDDANRPLWRLSLPSTTPPVTLSDDAREQLVEWGGALRWWKTHTPAHVIREKASQLGGHATLFRAAHADKHRVQVFHPLAPAMALIQRRLKAEFDPVGIFNRGRMYAGL